MNTKILIILIAACLTAPASAQPDLIVSEVNAYHYADGTSPWGSSSKLRPAWFNLTNYVDVTVENNGTAAAGAFHVSLYADSVLIGEKHISNLSAGLNETLVFEWKPIGIDEQDGGSPRTYSMLAEADPYSAVGESDEFNNNMTVGETVMYNGYMADEPLHTFSHGTLHGGLLFTTGNANYCGETGPGLMNTVQYNVDIPPTSSVDLAKLNIYYTWAKYWTPYPDLRIEITNQTGTYNLSLETSYHDRACSQSGWNLPWGNFVYDLSDYIKHNGRYTVSIYNNGTGYQCLSMASPGLIVLYRDDSMPLIEYWLAEGADVLIGGRRTDGGYLSLEECINNATFEGIIDTGRVRNAVLGMVSPWGEAWDFHPSVNYFNSLELGRCVYDNGYNAIGDRSLGNIRMTGTGAGQVGVNLSNVTGHLSTGVNTAGQGDDGDCMMPSNAFLVVEYKEFIKVNKTVWNGDAWVKKTDAELNDTLRFRCEVHNPGEFNLTDITVVDVLSDRFEYANNAAPYEPDWFSDSRFGWNFSLLPPSQTIVIEFNATAINYGEAVNILNAEAWSEEAGAWVVSEDSVNITVQRPGVCGDVTGNDVVDTGDVILLANYVGYPGYTLKDEWAGDVTGNNVVDTGDVILLANYVGYPGYDLKCR